MKLLKVECIDTRDYTYDIDELDSLKLSRFTVNKYLQNNFESFRKRTIQIHTFEITYSNFYFFRGICQARFAVDTNYNYILLDGWGSEGYPLLDKELEAISSIPQKELRDSLDERKLKISKEELLNLVRK